MDALFEGLRRTLAENADEPVAALAVDAPPSEPGAHARWIERIAQAAADRAAAVEQGFVCLRQATALAEQLEQRLAEPGLLAVTRVEATSACAALDGYARASETVLARLSAGNLDRVSQAMPALDRAYAQLVERHAALLQVDALDASLLVLSPAGARVRSLQQLRAVLASFLGGALDKASALAALEHVCVVSRDTRVSLRLESHAGGRWIGAALRQSLDEAEQSLCALSRAVRHEDVEAWQAAWRAVERAMLALVRRSDDCAAMRDEQPHLGTVL